MSKQEDAQAPVHGGHRRRTRDEFLARSDSFPDHKVLEVLLYYVDARGDTNPLAHALLERFGSLAGVLDALPEDLMKVPGVGERTAILLKVVKELSGRYFAARTGLNQQVRSGRAALGYLRKFFRDARNERVAVLCLDGKGRRLGERLISEGSVSAADLVPRKVVEAALSLNATQVYLAHNHVSGLALPSDEDKAATQYIARILLSVGVELKDHLILVDDDMVSMRDSGVEFFPRTNSGKGSGFF